MTKILHISKFYHPYAGGIEDVCYNIVRLAKSSKELKQKVFCFNDTNQTLVENYQGIEVIRVATWNTVSSQPLSMMYGKELKKIIAEYNPDVVHFHAPNPLGTYFLLRHLPKQTKLIVHWHSDIFAQRFIYQFIRPLETKLLYRANTIIATSKKYLECSEPLRLFVNKTIVIPNVIYPDKFVLTEQCTTQVRAIKQKYANLPIVLFVGRHTTYKGLKHLIEAAPLVTSKCAIVIGGKGELTEELRMANKSEKVHFVGRIDDDWLAAHYYAADVFAFPSVTKNEAFGVALAEAMYCGAVPVTFNIEGSGVNWVSEGGRTGIEVANGDSSQLAEAIDLLLSDKQLRVMMAENAHRHVENLFLIDSIAADVEQLYKKL